MNGGRRASIEQAIAPNPTTVELFFVPSTAFPRPSPLFSRQTEKRAELLKGCVQGRRTSGLQSSWRSRRGSDLAGRSLLSSLLLLFLSLYHLSLFLLRLPSFELFLTCLRSASFSSSGLAAKLLLLTPGGERECDLNLGDGGRQPEGREGKLFTRLLALSL